MIQEVGSMDNPSEECARSWDLRKVEIGGVEYITDLPKDVRLIPPISPYESSKEIRPALVSYLVNPEDFKKIPPGEYQVWGVATGDPIKEVVIRVSPRGLVIGVESMRPCLEVPALPYRDIVVAGRVRPALEEMGVEIGCNRIGQDVITGIPTPDTINEILSSRDREVIFLKGESPERDEANIIQIIGGGNIPCGLESYNAAFFYNQMVAYLRGGEPLWGNLKRISLEREDELYKRITQYLYQCREHLLEERK